MAEIWLARQSGMAGFSKVLVIKRMISALEADAEFLEMFLSEARVAAQLNHPNIVQIYELGESNGAPYIVMEYLDGESLALVRKQSVTIKQWMSDALAVRVVAQVAEALHAAHSHVAHDGTPTEIVHRDISPQNVIVTFDGAVKIVDFGIAKAATQATMSGKLKGKLGYMSPEQGRAEAVDRRADVFSLGIVMYEQLTHTRLYARDSDIEVLRQVISDAPLPRASVVRKDLPPALDEIIAKATARHKEERFATAKDMQLALEDWLRTCGQPSSSTDLAQWMGAAFPERRKQRRALIEAALKGSFTANDPNSLPRLAATPSNSRSGSVAPPLPPQDEDIDLKTMAPTVSDRSGTRRFPLAAVLVPAVMVLAIGGWFVGVRLKAGGDAPPAPAPGVEAPPTPGTAPATAALAITTDPAGAEIAIDGEVKGAAPVTLDEIAPGEHVVTAKLAGYQPLERPLKLSAGGRSDVMLALVKSPEKAAPLPTVKKPAAAKGKLNLVTKPWATVYLGTARLGDTPLVNVPLPAGRHQLRLVNTEAHVDQSIEVEIEPNETTVKKLKL
jgi:serine/threonine-protein kinase